MSGRTVINFCIKHASLFSKRFFTSLIWHFNTLAQILIKFLLLSKMILSSLCHQKFIAKCCTAWKRTKFHLFKFCRNRIAPEILHVNKPLLMESTCTIGDCTKEYYRFVMCRFCTLMCLTQPVGVPNISVKTLAYCRICQFKVNYKSVMFYSKGPVPDWKNEEVICWVEVHS